MNFQMKFVYTNENFEKRIDHIKCKRFGKLMWWIAAMGVAFYKIIFFQPILIELANL